MPHSCEEHACVCNIRHTACADAPWTSSVAERSVLFQTGSGSSSRSRLPAARANSLSQASHLLKSCKVPMFSNMVSPEEGHHPMPKQQSLKRIQYVSLCRLGPMRFYILCHGFCCNCIGGRGVWFQLVAGR
eukprot:2997423-Amphidinium_carterae.1